MKSIIIVCFLSGLSLSAGYWDSPQKNEILNRETPGNRIRAINPDSLLKNVSDNAMKHWKGSLSDESFAKFSEESDPRYQIGTDAEIISGVPSSISPFARLRNIPYPDIRPWLHWTGHFTQDQRNSYLALIGYCPFCDSETLHINFDKKNSEHAQTSCCKKDLYRNNAPPEYSLKPNSSVEFLFLDDTVRKIPCTLYTDKKGRTWELFIANIFNNRDWAEYNRTLGKLSALYKRTGNPLYPYKAAVLLDRMAETYYALPLALNNLNPEGKRKIGLSRAEWEEVPRPNIWAVMPKLGWWNRNNPTYARGWLNLAGEGQAAFYYALFRHHPAFQYYSRKKYGTSNQLDMLIQKKYIREINLAFSSVMMQGLIQNYQGANYTGMIVSALLGHDQTLLDFSAANHDCSIYNHHYADGLNGEGSVHYQGMLRRQFYPYMNEPDGWSQIDPEFHKRNPFFKAASAESGKQITSRGRLFEHGDIYHMIREYPNDRVLGNLETKENRQNEKLPSHVWGSWGIGVLRVGSPGHRLETTMNFSRPIGHGGLMMGLASWFDGIPVLRQAGYACPWDNLSKKGVDEINQLNFPRKAIFVPMEKPSVHESWNRLLAQSAIGQNSVTVNDVASVKRGISELNIFKGGESYQSPEAKFQVLEVNTIGEFKKMGVNITGYRRALIGKETSSGRAYVLDIVSIAGGQTQTVWYSIWGEAFKESGLVPIRKYNTLTDAFFNGKLPKRTALFTPEILYKWVYGVYNHVTKVRSFHETGEPWNIDFRADYYAYVRDGRGMEKDRPKPGFGIVDFRIAGIPEDPSTVIRAKAPWSPLSARQEVQSGAAILNKTITFDEAFDVVARRKSVKNGSCQSMFVTLLEGRHTKEKPVIAKMEQIPLSNAGAQAIKLHLTDGGYDIIFYQEGNLPLKANGIKTDARIASVHYDINGIATRLDMVEGNYLHTEKRSIINRAFDAGTIVDINADITGNRNVSELLIKPDAEWDLEAAKGRSLLIRVKRANGLENNEAFQIASAEKQSDGLIKLTLTGPAPFIISWHQAFFSPELPANKVKTNRPIQKFSDLEYYPGIKVLFPRTGKTYLVKDATLTELTLENRIHLKQEGIRNGDWFLFYAIEPGQRVRISRSMTKEFSEEKSF